MLILTITLIATAQATSNYPQIDKEDLTTSLDSKSAPNSFLEGFYDVVYVQSLLPRSNPEPDHFTSQDDIRYSSAKILPPTKDQHSSSESPKHPTIDQIENSFTYLLPLT